MLRTAMVFAVVIAMAAMAATTGIATPAGATTLVRAGLDQLASENATIVVGDVVEADSYWNAEGSFILTDVRFAVSEVVKGRPQSREIMVTLMGGQAGGLTALIVGGAQLIPGRSYVLFLNEEDLPGAKSALTVRDLCQGAFDLVLAKDGVRAVSQANSHPLIPDAKGIRRRSGWSHGNAAQRHDPIHPRADGAATAATGRPAGGAMT
jgi:hypothetical protein